MVRRRGGILSGSNFLQLQDCVIEENRSPREAYGHGAGINATGHQVSIDNCRICRNEAATEGGGLYLNVHGATITNTFLTGNRAGTYGGAIYSLESRPHVTPVLTNCVVADNYAQEHGGGLSRRSHVFLRCRETSPHLFNCTLARNRSGGVYCHSAFLRMRIPFSPTASSGIFARGRNPGGGNPRSDLHLRSRGIPRNRQHRR